MENWPYLRNSERWGKN